MIIDICILIDLIISQEGKFDKIRFEYSIYSNFCQGVSTVEYTS